MHRRRNPHSSSLGAYSSYGRCYPHHSVCHFRSIYYLADCAVRTTLRYFQKNPLPNFRTNWMNSASQTLIERAETGRALSRPEVEAFMEELLSGRISTPQIVRMLLALNQRTVSVEELSGFAR